MMHYLSHNWNYKQLEANPISANNVIKVSQSNQCWNFHSQVRKQAAQKLYEAIITYDDVVAEDKLDAIMTVLSDTNWWVVKLWFQDQGSR